MKHLVALGMMLLLSTTAHAAGCADNFANGVQPRVINPALNNKAYPLCYSEYATMFSGISRTPLYSAAHLTKERVASSKGLPRTNDFHEEERLPQDVRSWMRDYSRSGYDRGHVEPNGDMSNPTAQSESFTLANMVPQVAENNRGIWAAIEGSVRNLTYRVGDLYVVSGPVFVGANLRTVPSGRVLVPSHMFKAIYVPSTGETGVYLSLNDASGSWQPVSVNQLAGMTGFDPFPSVTRGKDNVMALPDPKIRSFH